MKWTIKAFVLAVFLQPGLSFHALCVEADFSNVEKVEKGFKKYEHATDYLVTNKVGRDIDLRVKIGGRLDRNMKGRLFRTWEADEDFVINLKKGTDRRIKRAKFAPFTTIRPKIDDCEFEGLYFVPNTARGIKKIRIRNSRTAKRALAVDVEYDFIGFECPVTFDEVTKATNKVVALDCGHIFSPVGYKKLMVGDKKCPFCRKEIDERHVRVYLANSVERYRLFGAKKIKRKKVSEGP